MPQEFGQLIDIGRGSQEDLFADPPGPRRKDFPRTLRSYQRTAQKEHWCDRCCQMIESGQQYEAFVEVHLLPHKRLIVWKYHAFPGCDYPPDPIDEAQAHSWETDDIRQVA